MAAAREDETVADVPGQRSSGKMIEEARDRLHAALDVLSGALEAEAAGSEKEGRECVQSMEDRKQKKRERMRIHKVSGAGGKQNLQVTLARTHQILALLYDSSWQENTARARNSLKGGGLQPGAGQAGESGQGRSWGTGWGDRDWVLQPVKWLDIVGRFEGSGDERRTACGKDTRQNAGAPKLTNFSRTWALYLDEQEVFCAHDTSHVLCKI